MLLSKNAASALCSLVRADKWREAFGCVNIANGYARVTNGFYGLRIATLTNKTEPAYTIDAGFLKSVASRAKAGTDLEITSNDAPDHVTVKNNMSGHVAMNITANVPGFPDLDRVMDDIKSKPVSAAVRLDPRLLSDLSGAIEKLVTSTAKTPKFVNMEVVGDYVRFTGADDDGNPFEAVLALGR